jgi:hypothetical protein
MKKYFNKATFGIRNGALAPHAILCASGAAFMLSFGGPIGIATAVVFSALTASYVNRWQEAATGNHFWKPKTILPGL